MIAIASNDKNLGYLTSSFTMESNTSSSSSPGNGDYKRQKYVIIISHNYYVVDIVFKYLPLQQAFQK